MRFFKKTKTYMIRVECYGEEEMEIGYQKDIDDLVIILTPDYKYDRSVEVDAGFIIDIDKNDKLVAIEVIDCSNQIDASLDYVEKAKKDAEARKEARTKAVEAEANYWKNLFGQN